MAPISLYSQQECSLQLDILKRKTISNNNSYFIKDSVTIWGINYRFQGFYANGSGKYIHVICLYILHYALPETVFYWKFCYMYILFRSDSSTAPELYMNLYWCVCVSYNGTGIDIFVYVLKYNGWLYLFLGISPHISPFHGLFYHWIIITSTILLIRLWVLYICLLWYIGLLHTICSLVVLHPRKLVIHVFFVWFVIPLLPSSLACMNKSGLTNLGLNYFSRALNHIYLFLISQYLIYFFLL